MLGNTLITELHLSASYLLAEINFHETICMVKTVSFLGSDSTHAHQTPFECP